jgi:16S rRNA (uracil1498-N3)-methyltransferase
MQRFYSTDITEDRGTLDENDSRHAIKSLRMQMGDNLEVVDGMGNIHFCEIENANAKKCQCKILETEIEGPSPYTLHMAVAPTKNIDRFEWFLEKATEMGITEITPLLTANSERKLVKPERLERILVSAMKQSLKSRLPRLNPMVSFKEFLDQNHKGDTLIAHCEQGEKVAINKLDNPNSDYTICIGPEGDFRPEEITLAHEKGFKALSLGNSRLRTETAALVAVASVYQKYI